jgi:hypothetical protein
VALASGFVGLALFCGFFLVILVELLAAMYRAPAEDRGGGAGELASDHYALGQALFCALLGILVMIFTTSSIGLIAVIYWAIAGLAQAYARETSLAFNPKDAAPRLVPAG